MSNAVRSLRAVILSVAALSVSPTSTVWAVTIDWVTVGAPGNACEVVAVPRGTCVGGVAYKYQISKYEVTNAQYTEFLNAKAASDPLHLWDTNMQFGAYGVPGGITRTGSPGSFTYSVIPGRENIPVNWMSFYTSLRFANWLNNGQGSGDTETGAYTLLGGTYTPSNGPMVTRNSGATIFLPSDDEWYKAAYYDPVSASYFDYPTRSNMATTCTTPGPTPNTANCYYAVGDLTIVGSYTGSSSPSGTFDQGGNLWEWTEAQRSASRLYRTTRGGNLVDHPNYLRGDNPTSWPADNGAYFFGFRVARSVPEPGTCVLLMTGVLALACGRAAAMPTA